MNQLNHTFPAAPAIAEGETVEVIDGEHDGFFGIVHIAEPQASVIVSLSGSGEEALVLAEHLKVLHPTKQRQLELDAEEFSDDEL